MKKHNKRIITSIFFILIFSLTSIIPILYHFNKNDNKAKNYIYLSNNYSNWGLKINFSSDDINFSKISNYNGFINTNDLKKIKNLKVYSRSNQLLYEKDSLSIPFKIAIPNKVNVLSFLLSFIGSICSIIIMFVAISIYKADQNRKLSKPFLILSFTPVTYYFTTMIQNVLATSGNEIAAGTFFAFHRLGFMFYPAAFYELCYRLSNNKKPNTRYQSFFYGIPVLLTPILLSWIIAGSDMSFIEIWKFSFNNFLQIFNLYTVLTLGISIFLLIKAVNDKSNPLYIKARHMIFGVLTAITILITLFIIPQLFLTEEPFVGYYDFIFLAVTLLFYTTLSYAVIRSHIINVFSILNQTIINIFISIITVVIYIFIQEIYLIYFKPDNILMHSALILFFLTIMLEPLRLKIKTISENIFFPEKTLLKPALSFYNEKIATNLIKEEIIENAVVLYQQILRVKKTKIMLFQDNFLISGSLKIEIKKDLFQKSFYHKNDSLDNHEKIRDLFEITESEVIIPLLCADELMGLLCLSKKYSEKPLTPQEISICVTIATNIALSLFNSEQNEQIVKNQKLLAHTEKLSAVGKLSASIAHEIKNPLATMKPLISMLPEMRNDEKFISDFMDIVPRQLDKINTKIVTLLSFSKKDKTSNEEILIEHVIDDVIRLLNINFKKNEITIVKNYDADDNKVFFSIDQLYSVFTNILLNSIDAVTENSGVIEISTGTRNNTKIITVNDNGSGISTENINKIFDPFFSTKKTGTGLGLSTVSQIINANNGNISVESNLNKGTTFTIKLPVI